MNDINKMENTNQETIALITEVTGLLPGTIEKYQWLVPCMERFSAVQNMKLHLQISQQKDLIQKFVEHHEGKKDIALTCIMEKGYKILNEQ